MTLRTMLLLAGLYMPAMAHSWPGPKYLEELPQTAHVFSCGGHVVAIVGNTPYRNRRNNTWKRVDHTKADVFSRYVCPENAHIFEELKRLDDER